MADRNAAPDNPDTRDWNINDDGAIGSEFAANN